jgi:hypothetical protein
MAVGLIFDVPGGTQAQYNQIRDEVAPGNRRPPGMLYHVAGATEQGWCVAELWESEEALTRCFEDKVRPALRRAGIEGQPRTFEVFNTMEP